MSVSTTYQIQEKDHPANIRALVNDRKEVTLDAGNTTFLGFAPGLRSANDYYPFGMLMPGRKFNAGKYRFGFQGQEKDDEIHDATGSSLAFKYRIHDARIGRFLSLDPLSKDYPWNSPFAFSENRVIDGVELEGLEYFNKTARVGFSVSYKYTKTDNYIRIDRQTYNTTKTIMHDFVSFARYRDDNVYESDAESFIYKIKSGEKHPTRSEWNNIVGKGRIVERPFAAGSKISKFGYGFGAVLVLALEVMDVAQKRQVGYDLNKTKQHIAVMAETVKIITIASEQGLIPDELNNITGKVSVANYILDSELPEYRDKDYQQKVKQVGKMLYNQRESLLKPKAIDDEDNKDENGG